MANYNANEMFGIEDDLISPNISDHFELYFPERRDHFPFSKFTMERALNGEVTNEMAKYLLLWDL
jgi:hypothetical protein